MNGENRGQLLKCQQEKRGRKTADRRTLLYTGGDIHRGPYRQTTSVYAHKLLIILLGQVGGGIANKREMSYCPKIFCVCV